MRARMLLVAVVMAVAVGTVGVSAQGVRPAGVFGSHMVLQRDMPLPVWGRAAAGETVIVAINGQNQTAQADAAGRWRVTLAPLGVGGGPLTMMISGSNAAEAVVLENLLVGDVWLCSGQSNMDWYLKNSGGGVAEAAVADYPELRLANVDWPFGPTYCEDGCAEPQEDIGVRWSVCSSNTAGGFSGVGYFFGRELHRDLKVPIGMMRAAVGGTVIQVWASRRVLEGYGPTRVSMEQDDAAMRVRDVFAAYMAEAQARDALKAAIEAATDPAEAERMQAELSKREAELAPMPPSPGFRRADRHPAGLFNGMIAPLMPFAIKGVIWYQGEYNTGDAVGYGQLFPAMITDWRAQWGQGDFPFLWVQLPGQGPLQTEPGESNWAELREAQASALRLPNTGQAVALDLGDKGPPYSIHPGNKRDVGVRLARVAEKHVYGRAGCAGGPVFEAMRLEGNRAMITFRDVCEGLEARGDALKGFAIAGDDRRFVWAEATIEGEAVVVSNSAIATPVAVRYGWGDQPVATLYDRQGFPAAPFRTDLWPTRPGE